MPSASSSSACGRPSKRDPGTIPLRGGRPVRTPSTGRRLSATRMSRVLWLSPRPATSRAWRWRSRPSGRCPGSKPSSPPAVSRRSACRSTGTRHTGSRPMRINSRVSRRRGGSISRTGCPRWRRRTDPLRSCRSVSSPRPVDGCRRRVRRTTTAARSPEISWRTSRRSARESGSRTSRTTAPVWRSRWNAVTGTRSSPGRGT